MRQQSFVAKWKMQMLAAVALGVMPGFAVQGATWINVDDHGANGTDTIDDTAYIQAAIAAANSTTGKEVSVDNTATLEPVAQGGVVYFPKGEYRISESLELHNVRLVGSLGTEIQAEVNGTYTNGAIFYVYGHSAIENLFLDFFVADGSADNDTDPSGNVNLTWIVATSTVNSERNQLNLHNVNTATYNPAHTFYRNEEDNVILKATNLRVTSWKYGLHLRGSFDTFELSNCSFFGVQDGFSDAERAFIYSDCTALVGASGGNTAVLSNSGCQNYYNGILMQNQANNTDGAPWHHFALTNTTFEDVHTAFRIIGSATPTLRATNCIFMAEQYHVLSYNSGPATLPGAERFIAMNNCSFSFRDKVSGVRNQRSIELSERDIPISITNCKFFEHTSTTDGAWPLNYPLGHVIISANGGRSIVFSNNTIQAESSTNRPPSDQVVRFLNPNADVAANGNIIRSVNGGGFSMVYDGVDLKHFTAVGNHTIGSIYSALAAPDAQIGYNTDGP